MLAHLVSSFAYPHSCYRYSRPEPWGAVNCINNSMTIIFWVLISIIEIFLFGEHHFTSFNFCFEDSYSPISSIKDFWANYGVFVQVSLKRWLERRDCSSYSLNHHSPKLYNFLPLFTLQTLQNPKFNLFSPPYMVMSPKNLTLLPTSQDSNFFLLNPISLQQTPQDSP
jgi:hypothetical protein